MKKDIRYTSSLVHGEFTNQDVTIGDGIFERLKIATQIILTGKFFARKTTMTGGTVKFTNVKRLK